MRFRTLASLISILSILTAAASLGHSTQEESSPHVESTQELIARLTPQQRDQYDQAGNAFNTQRYAEAVRIYNLLLKDLRGDPVLAKFSAEASLNAGDTTIALNALKPIAQASPDDWQAAALLTRACAESGDKTCRDSGIAHMLDLYKHHLTPPHMQQYIVERIKVGQKTLIIYTSLEPWGHYHVYNYAQIIDEAGSLQLRVTVESDDADQTLFARQHPKEAAAGFRSFSLDGYQDAGLNQQQQRTETHYTFKFFLGQPSYDVVRDAFISIANGQTLPTSSRVNILGQ
jgi:tetratricopeptide (TPR) repeat protein